MGAENSNPTSIRIPRDLRAYVNALSILTDQSLNAVIITLLHERLDADPLTKLQVVEKRGRHVIASAFTQEAYKAFASRDMALRCARSAIAAAGGDPANVIDTSQICEIGSNAK